MFPDTPPIAWRPTFRGLWRLDYLFFRLPDGCQAHTRKAASTYESDHRPVVGWMTR
jgi:endonuclease/exonuclease/phosphatase (EEP) superfamily protein YafD